MKDQAAGLRKIIKKVVKEEPTPSKRKARVITVTSGKGGVGKSNVTLNLAMKLQEKGKKVVVIDADFGLANIEVLFGIVPKFTLLDVIKGDKIITDILLEGPGGIKFISGGSGIQELTNLSDNQLSYFIKNLNLLDKIADVILIDTGAGVSDTVLTFVRTADDIILVATPDPTSVTDAYALIKILKDQAKEEDIPKLNLVVNSVSDDEEGNKILEKLKNVSEKFLKMAIEDIGHIPYDEKLKKSVKLQKPVLSEYPNSGFSKAIDKIATHFYEDDKNSKGFKGIKNFLKKFIENSIGKKS